MRNWKIWMVAVATLVTSAGSVARAGTIEFVPPNDTTGSVMSTNSNDGYAAGRGIFFVMTRDVTIDSLGILHNLQQVDLAYEIAEVTSFMGQLVNSMVLRSGSALVSTSGLEWIDFNISPLTLLTGNTYHLEFTHSGNGIQNFFYDNANVPFDQMGFTFIDGTQNSNAVNSVMPAIRVNEVMQQQVVPEPSTFALFGLGAAGLALMARRRRLAA